MDLAEMLKKIARPSITVHLKNQCFVMMEHAVKLLNNVHPPNVNSVKDAAQMVHVHLVNAELQLPAQRTLHISVLTIPVKKMSEIA